ncbi:hypothetical protein N9937_00285 [bacterium]|nr:hypothetical protein [bacterium]
MIVQQETRKIESNMPAGEAFTIKASGKAFRILSDGIYSNKPKAVIRELSCNALDSHREAGKPLEPFKVQLPNDLYPYFSVQDFGIGLSKKDVMELYTTYFASTKTESNLCTGALGLGSKSPFSYVDSFTIVSVFEGFKHSFITKMNEKDEPEINPVGTVATDECNGVTIQMPVKPADFHKFYDEACNVFQFFTTHPTISGKSNLEIPALTVDKSFGNVDLLTHSLSNDVVAVQGDVAYPVKMELLSEAAQQLSEFTSKGLVIWADIGSLDFAASREELSYDERTVTYLNTALEQAGVEYFKDMKDSVAECETMQQAKIKLFSIVESVNNYNDYTQKRLAKTLGCIWDGALVDISNFTVQESDLEDLETNNSDKPIKFSHFSRKNGRAAVRRIEKFEYTCHKDIKFDMKSFVVIDERSRFNAKINSYMVENNLKTVVAINHLSEDATLEFQGMLGGMPFVKTSAMAAPSASSIATNKPTNMLEYRYGKWRNTTVNFEDGGVFIELHRDEIQTPNSNRSLVLAASDYFGITVYGIRSKVMQKKFNKSDKWMDFNEYMGTVDIDMNALSLYRTTTVGDVSYQRGHTLEAINTACNGALDNYLTTLNELRDKLKSRGKGRSRLASYKSRFYSCLSDLDKYQIKSVYNLGSSIEGLTNLHPIFKLVDLDGYRSLSDEEIEVIAHYITKG